MEMFFQSSNIPQTKANRATMSVYVSALFFCVVKKGCIKRAGICRKLQGIPLKLQGICRKLQGISSMLQGIPTMRQGISLMLQGISSMLQGISSMLQGIPLMLQGISSMLQGIPLMLQDIPAMLIGVFLGKYGDEPDAAKNVGLKNRVELLKHNLPLPDV